MPAFEKARIQQALVVLLLDRSLGDPADEKRRKLWSRLPDQANDLLGAIGKKGLNRIDAALVSYGLLPGGQTELRTTFAGPLSGQTIVAAADLAAGAIRTIEVEEKIPNGIGGLITFTRRRQIYVDLEPLGQAPAGGALAAVAATIERWRGDRPAAEYPAIVVHLTRGQCNASRDGPAVEALLGGGAILYHHIVTESPHRSLSYLDSPGGIGDPCIAQLWHWSSPLLGAADLAADKRIASAGARGIVINAKFDLLLEGILASVGADAPV